MRIGYCFLPAATGSEAPFRRCNKSCVAYEDGECLFVSTARAVKESSSEQAVYKTLSGKFPDSAEPPEIT